MKNNKEFSLKEIRKEARFIKKKKSGKKVFDYIRWRDVGFNMALNTLIRQLEKKS